MAFNSSGVFSRLYSWIADRDAGIKIRADRFDAEMDGMATGLSTAILKDGTQIVTADIPISNHKFTGLAAGTANGDSVRYGQVTRAVTSTTDNAVARFDGTAGQLQDSAVTIADTGVVTITTTAGGTNLQITSTDGGTDGPFIELYHNSASPAASDINGVYQVSINDSGGNKTLGGQIYLQTTDTTDGSEDTSWLFLNRVAGTLTQQMTLNSTGAVFANGVTVSGAFTSLGIDDNATGERVQIADTLLTLGQTTAASEYVIDRAINTGVLSFYGGTNGGGSHSVLNLYGASHASNASDYQFQSGGAAVYQYDFSVTKHLFTGFLDVAATAGVVANINRSNSGSLLTWQVASVTQGTISESGGTITYGTFNGSHEAQLAAGVNRVALLRGTIIETVDEQSNWTGTPDRVLPKVKISDTPGSRRVYGVFFDWYDANPEDDTSHTSGVGADVIRMAPGAVVQGGDLIESNGDGCGRVQADDIMRASTVAKITSNVVAEIYPDGSYLVPCTLHCG